MSSATKGTIDPAQLRRKIEVAIGVFGDAPKRLIQDAKNLASKGKLPKSALVSRLSTLATHVQYRGCRDEAIESLNESLLRLPPYEVIDRLSAPLLAIPTDWSCSLAVSGKLGDILSTTSATSFRRRNRSDYAGVGGQGRAWRRLYSKQTHIVIQVSATSARHAAGIAAGRLSAVMDVHNLYHNSPAFKVHDKILVRIGSRPAKVVRISPSIHFGLLPRNEHRKLTRDRVKKIGARLEGRLSNALECHRLAVAADNPRAAIIDLWTALETLSGPTGPSSIGDRVVSKIAPLISWRRIDKVATYLSLEIHHARKFLNAPIDTDLFPKSTDNRFSIDDLLIAITGPDKNPAIMELFSMLSSFPLLCHRLYEAWKELHDPLTTRRRLLSSKKRVEWQIYRIYRARNLLVHQGEQSHLNWRLLQNMQFYVSITLGRVLHDLAKNSHWTVDSSLENHSQHYQFILDGLGAQSVVLTHGHLLGEKSRQHDRLIWPKPSRTATATAN